MAAAEPIKNIEQIREMKRIIEQGQNGYRNLLIFELGLATALRISDILRLKKRDIQTGFVRIETKKTGVYKKIELNRRVLTMVETYMENMDEDDFLFNIKYGQVNKTIKQVSAEVGLSNITTHSLRKTSAWHFYHESGKDLRKTMEFLGHKEPRETIRYLMLDMDEVNETLRGMDLD